MVTGDGYRPDSGFARGSGPPPGRVTGFQAAVRGRRTVGRVWGPRRRTIRRPVAHPVIRARPIADAGGGIPLYEPWCAHQRLRLPHVQQ
ncbi:hypothetical protein GCM10017559_67170 [Streptosporangium longisporum]|uniref:Uncharacterized protein n=1 Tax=Streptosporangium longisporum TaxID=46187 RepID=A0ABP6L7W9_9ACTN